MKEIMSLINIPESFGFVEIFRTSDGFFMGRKRGDYGFNDFIGKPSFKAGPGRDRSRSVWRELPFSRKRSAIKQARRLGIDLREVLGKGGA